MGKRAWIKIHCEPWLDKSVIKLSLAERGAWITLLCMAGNSDFGDIGVLQSTPNRGISVHQIAFLMDISVKQTKRYLDIFVQLEMITIKADNIIIINNWTKYQSEYSRQKSYRSSYNNSNTPKLQPKKENIEREKEKEKNKRKSTVHFLKPSVSEIAEYCKIRNNTVDPDSFHAFYASNGWKVGKNIMKDWQAAVRTWEQRNKQEEDKYL